MRTLRLAAATRDSSDVNSGSWNTLHQFGSIGSETGSLIGARGDGVEREAANQEDGDQIA